MMSELINSVLFETKQLSKHFGGLKAVDGVSMDITRGGLHSIIGPNGAGKTTFLNLLSGVYRPTAGKIFYLGKEITDLPPHKRAHLGIGRSYQITNIFPTLTTLENVRLAAQALGTDNFKMFSDFQAFPNYIEKAVFAINEVGLAGHEFELAAALSHGNKRRLEVAMLLAQDPDMLLLDEPTAGLGTEQVPGFMEMIKRIGEVSDKTIILVEHNMSVVMNLSDRISVMHRGQLLAEGTPAEITANETVQSAYLGGLYSDLAEGARK
jgi:branched-chain amino acid transport system ATP-binding protein